MCYNRTGTVCRIRSEVDGVTGAAACAATTSGPGDPAAGAPGAGSTDGASAARGPKSRPADRYAPPMAPSAGGRRVRIVRCSTPDMAVIGDFPRGRRHERCDSDVRRSRCTNPKRRFQAVVDPYARADFFISFGEEGVDLEEGFIPTSPSCPAGC